MKYFTALLSALVSLNPFVAKSDTGAAAGDVNASSVDAVTHVRKLSTADFDSFIGAPLSLVEFFAPWCGHCKKLAPEYEKAAEQLKEHRVGVASVDCTIEKELCQKYKVQGYPTLKIFREGEESGPYEGPRESTGIVRYMLKQTAPSVTDLTSGKQELSEFVKSDEVVFVANFAKDSEEAKAFKKLADQYRMDFTFGSFESPSLVAYKKFDEGLVKFSGDKFDLQSMTEFVKRESVPMVAEIGPENYARYMESGVPLAYFFYENEEQKTQFSSTLQTAIAPNKGRINAVWISATSFGQHADVLNLEKKWPAFVIHQFSGKTDRKFPLNLKEGTSLQPEMVSQHIKAFIEGSLKPTFKSESVDVAKASASEPIKVVVHDSFTKDVLDGSKDVLLEVYAPWCGACKNLAPRYEELAKKFAADNAHPNIVIAKMDGIANDLPEQLGFQLQHFPTLLFFPAKTSKQNDPSSSYIEYQGAPVINDLIDFISKNAVNPVKVEKEEVKEPAAAGSVKEDL